MDLSTKSRANIEYMIEGIKDKLQLVNAGALKAESFNTEEYDELRDIYEMVCKKENFSVSELEAIVTELGRLRSE